MLQLQCRTVPMIAIGPQSGTGSVQRHGGKREGLTADVLVGCTVVLAQARAAFPIAEGRAAERACCTEAQNTWSRQSGRMHAMLVMLVKDPRFEDLNSPLLTAAQNCLVEGTFG